MWCFRTWANELHCLNYRAVFHSKFYFSEFDHWGIPLNYRVNFLILHILQITTTVRLRYLYWHKRFSIKHEHIKFCKSLSQFVMHRIAECTMESLLLHVTSTHNGKLTLWRMCIRFQRRHKKWLRRVVTTKFACLPVVALRKQANSTKLSLTGQYRLTGRYDLASTLNGQRVNPRTCKQSICGVVVELKLFYNIKFM